MIERSRKSGFDSSVLEIALTRFLTPAEQSVGALFDRESGESEEHGIFFDFISLERILLWNSSLKGQTLALWPIWLPRLFGAILLSSKFNIINESLRSLVRYRE